MAKGKLSREEAKMWEDEKVEWTDLSSVRARSDFALTLTLLAFLHQRGDVSYWAHCVAFYEFCERENSLEKKVRCGKAKKRSGRI